VTHPLDGIDLVVFDKDGTLIEFHAMWGAWAVELADGLARTAGPAIRDPLYGLLGFDPVGARVTAGGRLAATPMARIRDDVDGLLAQAGLGTDARAEAMADAWHAPDPVALARPITDLAALFAGLRTSGRTIAVATSDDRDPTIRTLDALGLRAFVAAIACADDGLAVKPAPDAVTHICASVGIAPERTAMVGDSVADLAMGAAAGVALCYGVLTGVATEDELAPFADAVLSSVAALAV
jgi:phosphoglycolate phosphatase-like HAD superfamily hydrolase